MKKIKEEKKFIRYKNNKYLITFDNWSSRPICEDKPIGNEEKSSDKIIIGKLRYEQGDTLANIILKEIDKIIKIYKKYSDKKVSIGDALEVFAISVLHYLDYEECLKNNIVIGDYDGKVDAIFFDEKKCIVYQIKNSVISDDDLDIAKKHINQYIENNEIFDEKNGDRAKYKHLFEFCEKHSKELLSNECIYMSISTNKKKNNYSIDDIYKMFFSNLVNYLPNYQSNIILNIKFNYREDDMGNEVADYASAAHEFFIFVNANELITQLNIKIDDKKSLDNIFGCNVRRFIGENQEIQYTISNEKEMFSLYNNGISVIGDVKIIGGHFEIKYPLFVNGQQTIINLVIAKSKGIDISSIVLPLFIKNIEDENKILSIAKYNNTQKPIKRIDLLSLNKDIRKIQQELFKSTFCDDPKECYWLNIYSSGKKDNTKMRNNLVKKENQIKLIDFIRLYSCLLDPSKLGEWKNNPDKMIENMSFNELKYEKEADIQKFLKICKSISKRTELCKDKNKRDYKYASVALEFLLYCLDCDVKKSANVIDYYTNKYYYNNANKPKNIADIYKNKDVYTNLVNIYKDLYKEDLRIC